MIVDVQALASVVIGLICAALFVLWNKKHLIYLVCALQLVTDKKYIKRLVDTINTQNFTMTAGYKYHLMPFNEHTAAFATSKSTMQHGITSEYVVIAKAMVFQLIRINALPFVVSILIREPLVYVGAVIIGISTLVLYQIVFAHGKNYIQTIQIALLLRHAYSYRNHSVSKFDTSSICETFQHSATRSLVNESNTESNQENSSRQEYDAYNSTNTYLEKQHQLTWQRVWWINDALLCLLLIGMYWFTTGNSIEESMYGSIQIMLFVQIFFVPVWLVITIAQKLLSNHSS